MHVKVSVYFNVCIRTTEVIPFDCFPFISSFVPFCLFVFRNPRFLQLLLLMLLFLLAICKVSLFLFYFIHYFCTLKTWCWRSVCVRVCVHARKMGEKTAFFLFYQKYDNPVEKFLARSKETRQKQKVERERERRKKIALTIYHNEMAIVYIFA